MSDFIQIADSFTDPSPSFWEIFLHEYFPIFHGVIKRPASQWTRVCYWILPSTSCTTNGRCSLFVARLVNVLHELPFRYSEFNWSQQQSGQWTSVSFISRVFNITSACLTQSSCRGEAKVMQERTLARQSESNNIADFSPKNWGLDTPCVLGWANFRMLLINNTANRLNNHSDNG